MAVTVTKEKVYVTGDRKRVIGKLTWDTSYPTNGQALTAAALGLELELNDVRVAPAGGYVYEWDRANLKVKAYRQTAATSALIEVPNTTDISASVPRFEATGKGSATA